MALQPTTRDALAIFKVSTYNKFMYIENRLLSAAYKFITSMVGFISFFFLINQYQAQSPLILSTWLSLAAAIYFLFSTVKILFFHRKSPWKAFCPVIQGTLIIGGFLVLTSQIVASNFPEANILISAGVSNLLASYVLPTLILFDWVLFSAKGHWRFVDPWYWLCLPLIYVAVVYLIVGATVSENPLVYPYAFLDYLTFDLILTFVWLGGTLAVTLIVGYCLVASDRALATQLKPASCSSKDKTAVIAMPQTLPSDQPNSANQPNSTDRPKQQSSSSQPEASPEAKLQTSGRPIKLTKSPKAAKAAKTTAIVKTARAASSSKTDKSAQSPRTSKTAKTSKSAKTIKLTDSTKIVKAAKSTQPPKSSKISKKPTNEVIIADQAEVNHDTRSTRSIHGGSQVGD